MSYNPAIIQEELDAMRSKITAFGARLLIWNFSKLFRSGIQSLFVDMSGVTRINKLVAEGKRVILLPMY